MRLLSDLGRRFVPLLVVRVLDDRGGLRFVRDRELVHRDHAEDHERDEQQAPRPASRHVRPHEPEYTP
ncbi:hypothetical protein GCM10010470_57920 [Saccharopolyspora taberi]|uniref:Secreted protein n=1 Tax=Saccharopolyspora taberi TaxID=60895 RepID=A0ABN3VMC5_9PSEU